MDEIYKGSTRKVSDYSIASRKTGMEGNGDGSNSDNEWGLFLFKSCSKINILMIDISLS